MSYLSEADWIATEDHCYFPEWADRPPAAGNVHEVDRNSYLAGGYAEEFGHRARPLHAQGLSVPVEGDGEWRVQIGGLHPGYPECPRPLDRRLFVDGSTGPGKRPRAGGEAAQPQKEPADFKVVLVGQKGGSKPRHGLWTPWRKLQIRRKRLPLS